MTASRRWSEGPIPGDVTVVAAADGHVTYDRHLGDMWHRRGTLYGMHVYLDEVDLFEYLGTVVEVTDR